MGFILTIVGGPILGLVALRMWGPVQPVAAIGVAIACELGALSLRGMWMRRRVSWMLAHPDLVPSGTMFGWSTTKPKWSRRFLWLGLFSIVAAVIAGVFLVVQLALAA